MNPGIFGGGRVIQLQALKNQALISDKCFVAERFFDRLRGLIGKSGLGPGEAMLFPRCSSIHMWFMGFPIDVVFLRRQNRADGKTVLKVSSVHEHVRPWRPHPLMDFRANDALELPEGTIRRHAINVGDELCIG